MEDLSLIDPAFQKERSKQYHLSLQADMSGLVFCVFDLQQKKHTVFRKYPLQTDSLLDNLVKQLAELVKKDDLLSLPYHSSSFMFLSQKSTLVPDAYFDQNHLKKYLSFNQDLDNLDEIHFNYLASIDAYNVFALHTYVANEIVGHFPGITLYHQGSTFIEKQLELTRGNTKDCIAVNMNTTFFDLLVCSGGKLKLYNTFSYSGQTDLLYFIVYISKQFNCEPAEVRVLLSGEAGDLALYYEAIRNYFPGVQYSRSPVDGLSTGLARIREYNYLNLFSLANCE